MILPSEPDNRVRHVTITHVAQHRLSDTVHRSLSTVHFLFGLVPITLLLAGCATAPKPPPVYKPPVMPVAAPVVQSNLAWSAQYAGSLTPSTGFNTFEVYIENRGTNTVTFESATLNGNNMPLPNPAARLTLPDTLMIDGMPVKLDPIKSPAAELATWWQFYPDRTVDPGQTIQFQINFRATPTTRQRLQRVWPGSGPAGPALSHAGKRNHSHHLCPGLLPSPYSVRC